VTEQTTPAIVYVTYQGHADTHFDRTYYVDQHLPLVMRSWRQYGLESAAAFFPAVADAGTIAICELRFRDEAAMDAAFAAPETPAVKNDVSNFTAVSAAQSRAMPL
jgi:uncharacterized protein (TIGR02118 family)